ncbi:CLUMA_CG018294, isoform A [Clunio marinus]|uniref:CLUMA_CG018294, isoform A n=1 Tax=Clunio marinus TaxID=568069 RepID=A0A1J1J1R0_9DIPT|nr:CLUMA_CG018294, isoform A [Clunio marinus]
MKRQRVRCQRTMLPRQISTEMTLPSTLLFPSTKATRANTMRTLAVRLSSKDIVLTKQFQEAMKYFLFRVNTVPRLVTSRASERLIKLLKIEQTQCLKTLNCVFIFAFVLSRYSTLRMRELSVNMAFSPRVMIY